MKNIRCALLADVAAVGPSAFERTEAQPAPAPNITGGARVDALLAQ